MSEGQQRPARQDAAWRRVSRDYEYEDAYGDQAEYPDQRELSGYDALNGVSAPDRPRSRPSGHPPSRYAERRAIPARRFSAPPSGPGPHRTAQPARLRDYTSNGPLRSPRDTERPDAEARRMRPVAEWESWDDSASDHEPAPEDWEPPRYGSYSRRASLGWDE